MIVYDGLKSDFLKSVEQDTLAQEIEQCVFQKLGRHTVENEFRSWVNSYNYMYKVLRDSRIPENAGIAIEYNIPQTAKRVDFMISGYDEERHPNMVIVELKQWSSLETVAQSETLVETFVGGGNRKVVHPSYQAWSYAQLISIVIGNPLKLSPGFPPLHTGHATFTASGVPSSIVSAVIHNHSFTLAKFATLLPKAAALR